MVAQLMGQFNRLGNQRKTLIRKALDSSAGTGEALVPEKLEQIITNAVVRLSPEMALIQSEYDAQKYHEFNRLNTLPAAGGAMGEGATTPTRNSSYSRQSVQLKVVRRKGAVTNFLQDASKNYIDAAAAEMENHLQAHVYDINTYNMYGNAGADQYTWNGLDKLIVTNRTQEVSAGLVPTDLGFLDDMIDANLSKQGAPHKKAFMMSPYMQSKVSQLLTNVRLNNGLQAGGLTEIEINGGWRMMAYRNIPIIPTNACRPTSTMGTVVAAAAGAGSGITDATYYFRVAAITYDGEQTASAEANVTTSSNDTVSLTFTAVAGALYYKVYCGTSSGAANTTLVSIVSAVNYDASGTIGAATTNITFSSDPNVANPTITIPTNTGYASPVPTGMQSDVPLIGSGGVPSEVVMLWDLDKYQGLGKFAYTNTGGSRFQGLVTMQQLAQTDDNVPFLIKTYGALVDAFEATSAMHRNLRVQ